MKAAINGGLNLSVLDGWWCEGYADDHGWTVGGAERHHDAAHEDHQDAEALYRVLSEAIVPCFYERDETDLPREWIRKMKRSMGRLTPRFSSSRMVREYSERFYFPED